MGMNIRNTLIVTIVTFCCAAPVFALPSVTIPPSDSGTYSVEGSNMDGVAGVQLDVAYDAASLSTPTVTKGALVADAILVANTSLPGLIKIAVISTHVFSGSGRIATISFASKTGSGGITSITASMIDSKGAALLASSPGSPSADGSTVNPGVPVGQPAEQALSPVQQQGTSVPPASGTVSTTPVYPGTVTLPADLQQKTDAQPPTPSQVPVSTEGPAAEKKAEQTQLPGKPAADRKDEESQQHVIYKGIIGRFKQYKGSKDFSSMVALFDKKGAQTFLQEPAILLSNGKNKAALTVDLPTKISSSPNIAVNGGTLVSFRQDKNVNGRWTVEVLPAAGAVRVTITILAGGEEFEFPLTVAPPIKTALSLDERGWNRFLKELGTTKAPLHDLNNDGVRDYIDEFIFIANHLAGIRAPAASSSTPRPSAK